MLNHERYLLSIVQSLYGRYSSGITDIVFDFGSAGTVNFNIRIKICSIIASNFWPLRYLKGLSFSAIYKREGNIVITTIIYEGSC